MYSQYINLDYNVFFYLQMVRQVRYEFQYRYNIYYVFKKTWKIFKILNEMMSDVYISVFCETSIVVT